MQETAVPPALHFDVVAESGRARAAVLSLPHYRCETPMFMPVGTQGTLKGLTTEQLEELDCHVILGNTYHLGMRPGPDVMAAMGGLHEFMRWPRGLLTDSGGFQMVSLVKLSHITEEGVSFISPHDGRRTLLTPEHSIELQMAIGADIVMQLDDVVSSLVEDSARMEEAMHRSVRWLDRCIARLTSTDRQNLFAIIQGGLIPELRERCLAAMVARNTPGYAIGGLAGGESKEDFWRIMAMCTPHLPRDKPRYAMGIGYAEDLVVCVALGVDMFDCVYPTRTARFGTALIRSGDLDVRSRACAADMRPIDAACGCKVCRTYSRAYLHTIAKEAAGAQLLSYHNIAFQMRLMRDMRLALAAARFPEFVVEFMRERYASTDVPGWIVDALHVAGIALPFASRLPSVTADNYLDWFKPGSARALQHAVAAAPMADDS